MNRPDITERVLRLCDDVAACGSPALVDAAAAVRSVTTGVMRVAVVGRVKAGKSTLVNAIVGRRVAPTDEAECTRVVAHVRFGAPERGEAHLRDGGVHAFALERGGLPSELPWPPEEVAHVVVHVQEKALRDLVLIDTPGLSTTIAAHEQATRRAVLESQDADALVYVVRDVERLDDAQFLREYAGAVGARADAVPGPATAIGVLSHADLHGGGPWGEGDPVTAAADRALQVAAREAAYLATVVPVAGRMAESARCGRVTEQLCRTLTRLGEVDEIDLRFPEGPVTDDVRAVRRLVGDYGLRHGRAVAPAGATAMTAWLLERSRMADLLAALRGRYLGLAPELQARDALDRLRDAGHAAGPPWSGMVLRLIAEARAEPVLHGVAELSAWEELRVARPEHRLVAELEDLLAARAPVARRALADPAPGGVRTAAVRRAAVARREAALAGDPVVVGAARTVERSWTLVARDAETVPQ